MPGDTQLAQGKDRFGRGVNAVPKSFLSSMKPEHISTAGFLSLKQIADRHTGRAPETFHGEKKKKKCGKYSSCQLRNHVECRMVSERRPP